MAESPDNYSEVHNQEITPEDVPPRQPTDHSLGTATDRKIVERVVVSGLRETTAKVPDSRINRDSSHVSNGSNPDI